MSEYFCDIQRRICFAIFKEILTSCSSRLKDRQEWYPTTYSFYPCVILSLRKSSKFLRMLDWRGGVVIFDCYFGDNSKVHSSVASACHQCGRFTLIFPRPLMQTLSIRQLHGWRIMILKGSLQGDGATLQVLLFKQKMERQARKRLFDRTVRTPGRRACLHKVLGETQRSLSVQRWLGRLGSLLSTGRRLHHGQRRRPNWHGMRTFCPESYFLTLQ